MRVLLLGIVAVAMVACGNYSNDDIAFLDALPSQQALQVNVPQPKPQALTELASLYAGTVQTAQGIDAQVEKVIALVDLVRSISPTSRGLDMRTWGPFADSTPGFEDQVVIRRSADTYTYELDLRPVGGTFATVLSGTFVGATALGGHGTLDLETAPELAMGHPVGDPNLQSLRFVYANDSNPRTVNTTIVGVSSGQTTTLTYTYSESVAEGDLDYDYTAPSDAGLVELRVQSRWQPDGGAGRARGVGEVADFPGDSVQLDQCWDDQFQETYYDSQVVADLSDGGGIDLGPSVGCDAAAGEPCPRGNPDACEF